MAPSSSGGLPPVGRELRRERRSDPSTPPGLEPPARSASPAPCGCSGAGLPCAYLEGLSPGPSPETRPGPGPLARPRVGGVKVDPTTRSRARAFERLRRKSRQTRALEAQSPLRSFFGGGLELDGSVDASLADRLAGHVLSLLAALEIPREWGAGVELKIRRLGAHRADGLFFNDPLVLAVDPRSLQSFAHELGHLLDYRATTTLEGRTQWFPPSRCRQFEPYSERLVRRLQQVWGAPRARRGRLSAEYFSSGSETFARAFEQFAAERAPRPCLVAADPERLRADALYFNRFPPELGEILAEIIRKGPARSPPAAPPLWPRVEF